MTHVLDATGNIRRTGTGGGGGGSITVKEVDGSPSVSATTIEFQNGTVTDHGSGLVEVNNSGGGTATYPKRATMWHDEALITVGNALNVVHDANQNYGVWSDQNTPSTTDKFTQSFMLQAGTYTFSVLGITGNNYAKLDWYIDGASVVTGEDWYSGSTTYNVLKTHGSIVVATDGYHTLEGRVNGHNGSSTDYYILLTKYWFTPSAD